MMSVLNLCHVLLVSCPGVPVVHDGTCCRAHIERYPRCSEELTPTKLTFDQGQAGASGKILLTSSLGETFADQSFAQSLR